MSRQLVLISILATSLVCTASVAASGADSNLTEASANPEIQRAVSVWQGYVAALKDGDREKAMGYWSPEARQHAVFDWQMPDFDQAVALARSDSLVLRDAKEHEVYTQLLVTALGDDYTYYVVPTQTGAVFANPVEVLTRGWLRKDTPQLIFHYPAGNEPTDDQIATLQEFCSTESAELGVPLSPGRPLDYYKCDSPKQVGDLFGERPAAGRAYIRNGAVAATSWMAFHEIVHVLIGQTCREQPSSVLLEGAACYWGGTSSVTRLAQLSWAKALVENHANVPLSTLIQEDDFWSCEDMNDSYAEAAAFTGFLLTKRGVGVFKSLYAYRDSTENLAKELERVYGEKLPELERQWREWLVQLDVPTIRLDGDRGAKLIFTMKDPRHDDDGTGDYAYPLARGYRPGMFDLTGVSVRAGGGRVYFELKYRRLVDDWGAESDWGFSGTFTRIAIDAGGHGNNEFGRDSHASLAGNCDYRIDISGSAAELRP